MQDSIRTILENIPLKFKFYKLVSEISPVIREIHVLRRTTSPNILDK